jgi:hypothetical protein
MKHLILFGATLFSTALHGQSVTYVQYSSSVSAHDLIITEVLADPSPQQGLPPVEFVELLNRSQQDIDLTGWTFYEGSAKNLPSKVLPAGSYLIVCAASDTAWFTGYGITAGLSSFSLTNSGEKIAIRAPSGLSIDSLTFSDSWYGGTYKGDGGWTLERVDTSFVCFHRNNWLPADNSVGGTPGQPNSVAALFSDNEPPVPLRAYCPDATSVKVIFSEALEPVYIDSIEVSLTSGNQVADVISGGSDNGSILILLADSVKRGIVYECVIGNVRDCPGNKMEAQQILKYGLPDTLLPPDVVINEVLFNPPIDGVDFIELYNRGTVIADLTLFTVLSYDEETGQPDEVSEIDGEPWLLFPGAYAIVTESPSAIAAHYRSPYPAGFVMLEDLPAMNIDAGEIGVLFKGDVIDRFEYNEEYHFDLLNDVKGISLERIDPFRTSADISNWHSAAETAGFATPGSRNSQFATGEFPQAEVFAAPEIFSPDNDGLDDVVTFHVQTPGAGYIGSVVIYHSEGRPVKQLASQQLTGTENTYSWDGTTDWGSRAPLGLYVAVLQFFSIEGDVRQYKVPVVLAVKFER